MTTPPPPPQPSPFLYPTTGDPRWMGERKYFHGRMRADAGPAEERPGRFLVVRAELHPSHSSCDGCTDCACVDREWISIPPSPTRRGLSVDSSSLERGYRRREVMVLLVSLLSRVLTSRWERAGLMSAGMHAGLRRGRKTTEAV